MKLAVLAGFYVVLFTPPVASSTQATDHHRPIFVIPGGRGEGGGRP